MNLLQVMGGVTGGGHHTAAEGKLMLLGNMCLLVNTLASAVYYLGAKRLVQVNLPKQQHVLGSLKTF